MPLLVLPQAPSAPPPVTPRLRPAKRFVWTSAGGDVVGLSDRSAGYRTLAGRAGFGLVPRDVIFDDLPDGGGSLRTIRDLTRVIPFPLYVTGGGDPDLYRERYQRLQRAFRHRRGGVDIPGTLAVELPDGSRREIRAFYHGGLDPVEDVLDDMVSGWMVFPRLEFLALDPYWTGGQVSFGPFSQGSATAFLGAMPFDIATSTVLGTATVDMPGDADAYPIWVITGPGTPTLSNETTGRSFEFATAVTGGDTITIDTRPDQLSVKDQTGTDQWGMLEDFADLWPLEPGVNDLTVDIAAADANSSISATARARHQTGW